MTIEKNTLLLSQNISTILIQIPIKCLSTELLLISVQKREMVLFDL